ncbi:MAG: type I polyketide synthase, partial [Ilumatobacteraceae bacterium]
AVVGGSFRTHVVAPAALVVPKPPALSFEEAAGLLIANVTADFSLRHLGRMQAGERVLVHAAAGGVGLAAVGLAQRVGAEVFATAGSAEKRAFLASLGVRHIYDSRTLAFADAIRADTGGEGVDLVLNSLAGDFVGHSLGLLREHGRFLEIGKRDHLGADEVRRLDDRSIEYHVIDWGETAETDPQLIRGILVDIVAASSSGELAPLPVRVFPFSEAQEAFRYMAQARHIGKVVVAQPAAAADVPAPGVRPDASYLITGGLSGLGLLTAGHLVNEGARHLVLMGRRPPSDASRETIASLEAAGAQVAVVQGDVSKRADVEAALGLISATMPPLRGVIHSAGALDDGAITNQSWARFRTVLAPKVDGARHLHELTAGAALDHFVMYSSVASLLGSPGQANHAAANAYLDALAHQRRSRGQVALSINWGAWAEVGAAAERGVDKRTEQTGIGAIDPDDGLALLGRLMHQSAPQVGVTPVQWKAFLQRYPGGGAPPYFAEQAAAATAGLAAPATPVTQPDVRRKLEESPAHRRGEILLTFVREQAAHVLALTTAQIDDHTPLSNLGLDSLMAVELRNLLGAGLGAERPLQATLVFDYPTVAAIAGYLGESMLTPDATEAGPTAVSAPPDGAGIESMLDDLESLSDDEIDRLLAGRADGRSEEPRGRPDVKGAAP